MPLKVATPATAVTIELSDTGPESTRASTWPVKLVATFPATSRAWTTTSGSDTPATCGPTAPEAITSETAAPAVAVAVAVACAAGTLVTVAVMLCTPSGAPRVHAVRNSPATLVLPITGVRLPPPEVTAMLTCVALTGLPKASVTRNATESVNVALTAPVCAAPATTVITVGAAAEIPSAVLVTLVRPDADAVRE